ncbi:unnamed protein product [Rhodiola kirilowii]
MPQVPILVNDVFDIGVLILWDHSQLHAVYLHFSCCRLCVKMGRSQGTSVTMQGLS